MSRPGKRIPWRRDLAVLERLPLVERRHLAGESNVAIAAALGVAEATVRDDLKRLRELWLERIGDSAETLRAQAVAELEDVRRRSLAAAEFDEMAERAVLFGEVPGGLTVERDDKGAAQFRGNKAASLNVARAATMDKAKVLGLVVEKRELSGDVGIRQYVGVDVDAV